MSVVQFPGRRLVPPKASVHDLLDQVELELLRARLAQIRSEHRQAAALFAWWWAKRLAFCVLVFWLLTTFARAEGKQFYNANGSFAGSEVKRPNGASYYDGSGRYSGSSVKVGPTTNYYDNAGRYSGSTIERGPRR
jgi:hypothetical protein